MVYPSLPVEEKVDTSQWFAKPRIVNVPMSTYIGSVVSGFEALFDRPKAVSCVSLVGLGLSHSAD